MLCLQLVPLTPCQLFIFNLRSFLMWKMWCYLKQYNNMNVISLWTTPQEINNKESIITTLLNRKWITPVFLEYSSVLIKCITVNVHHNHTVARVWFIHFMSCAFRQGSTSGDAHGDPPHRPERNPGTSAVWNFFFFYDCLNFLNVILSKFVAHQALLWRGWEAIRDAGLGCEGGCTEVTKWVETGSKAHSSWI